jgi:protein-S-isoprenylcysteine O-methyltransferase Ste14
MRLRLVPAVFLALATLDGADATRAIGLFSAHASARHGLLALHAVLRTAVGLAFAYFTARRSEPRRYAREPVAFLACAVAMLAVAPVASPSRGTPSGLLLAGDAVAVIGSVWIFASVLALGHCFGVLPEARGLVTHGPYRLVRHPVYLGEIGAMAGLTLAAPALLHLAMLGIFVLAQSTRMGLEERALSEAFAEYASYAARTPRLVPAPRVVLGLAIVAIAALGVAVIPAQAGVSRQRRGPKVKHPRQTRTVAGLRAPALQSPAADASLQGLPAFEWGAVAHSASYQFQLAADPRFGAIVGTGFFGNGSIETHNTAATLDTTVPDGVYWWRVRAVTRTNSAGPWSAVRRLVKAWTSAPQLYGPNATTVDWPSQPLVFRWSTVPYATKYLLTVATDPALASQVIGTATQPLETQATVYTPSAPLTVGTYFWAVTPLDARGHRGTRSAVASFTYDWPTATATGISDLEANPGAAGSRLLDPQFSWAPVAGAARYEVEVNSAEEFAAGSKWCCERTTIGTSLAPPKVLANNSQYYWRVRSIDPRGNAGVWNYGPPFTKAFDDATPSIPNLTVRDAHGNALSGVPAIDTPIVTWDPVRGASRYEVQVVPYQGGLGCDWSQVANHTDTYQAETATTAWTPLGNTKTPRILAYGPSAQETFSPLPAGGVQYCLRVLARSDDDAQGGQVVSGWTQINGPGKPAFAYEGPKAVAGPLGTTSAYIQPAPGSVTPRTPLFTWEPVAGAQGYYVVISRDASFTNIADVGYTNVPAYAPRLANEEPLKDDSIAYHWAVIPAAGADGSGVPTSPQENSPQTFNKSSVPPTSLTPVDGTVVSAQPSFRWTPAENARNYELQVAADPSFGKPLDDVSTDATAYTSSSTYPADTTLYWRVRANDWNKVGLNWSATKQFVRTLPAPVPSPSNATGGEPIPVLGWSAVRGAIGYEVHVDKIEGSTLNFSFPAPAFTPVEWYGVGVWRWQVRADFPSEGVGGAVSSGYSAPVAFVRTLDPPSGAYGVKTPSRLVISWDPDPAAKQYEVDVSTSDGFATTVDSHRTDNTSWAPSVDLTTPQNRGQLYWRVAAVDDGGNVGAFATGTFGKSAPAPKAKCGRVVRGSKGHRIASRCSSHKHRRKNKNKRKGKRGHH